MNIHLLPAVLVMVSTVALVEAAIAGTALIDAAAYPEGPLWRNGKLLYVENAGPGMKQWDGQHSRVRSGEGAVPWRRLPMDEMSYLNL